MKEIKTNNCIDCGKLIWRHSIRCRKCQDKRHSMLMKGTQNCKYKDGRTLKTYYCIDCNKEISYQAKKCQSCASINRFKGKTYEERFGREQAKKLKKQMSEKLSGIKRSKETKKRLSLSKGGTGIPYENNEYSEKFNKSLKTKIKKRDNYTCQLSGITEKEHLKKYGTVLTVHHIDYNKENCEEYNLITLTKKWNLKVNYNRKYWTEYFLKQRRYKIHGELKKQEYINMLELGYSKVEE